MDNPEPRLERVISVLKLDISTVLCIYLSGSRLYGTITPKSDFDYVIVVQDGSLPENKGDVQISMKEEQIDGLLYTQTKFIDMIQKHDLVFRPSPVFFSILIALECLWLPDQFIKIQKITFNNYFILDLGILRNYVSSESNYCWVRSKKKLIVEKDFNPYRARKTLWHAFRVIDFGIQIIKFGKIQNYSSKNDLFWEIYNNESVEWKIYQETYNDLFNQSMTEFRKFAPKIVSNEKKSTQGAKEKT